ncbi:MAG TPA: arginase family protein [Daejeonella sp.]|nr:arginase family protein [Daejeonella sp.]
MTEREAGNLVSRLMTNDKVCCFEIVEVNPTLDKENQMAEHAFEILLRATNSLTND